MSDGNAEFTESPEISPEQEEERLLITSYADDYFNRFQKALLGTLTEEQTASLRQTAKELAEEKRRAEKLYMHDRLMDKLLTRAALDDTLEQAFAVKEREGNTDGVMAFIDVNNLKSTNDTLGHDIGDEGLKIVSNTVAEGTRPSDIIGRFGGDEILIFLKDLGIKEAALVATRLRGSLDANSQGLRQRTEGKANFTFSIGLVPYRKGITLEQLRKEADETMYVAKHQLNKDAIAISGLTDPKIIEETHQFLSEKGIPAPIVSVPKARQAPKAPIK